jgi:hypothetical protein
MSLVGKNPSLRSFAVRESTLDEGRSKQLALLNNQHSTLPNCRLFNLAFEEEQQARSESGPEQGQGNGEPGEVQYCTTTVAKRQAKGVPVEEHGAEVLDARPKEERRKNWKSRATVQF